MVNLLLLPLSFAAVLCLTMGIPGGKLNANWKQDVIRITLAALNLTFIFLNGIIAAKYILEHWPI